MPTSKTTRKNTKRVELMLLPAVYQQLKQIAAKEGLTMTTILKLALKQYIKQEYNIDCED